MDIYTYVLYISSRFKYIYKVRYILLYIIVRYIEDSWKKTVLVTWEIGQAQTQNFIYVIWEI